MWPACDYCIHYYDLYGCDFIAAIYIAVINMAVINTVISSIGAIYSEPSSSANETERSEAAFNAAETIF